MKKLIVALIAGLALSASAATYRVTEYTPDTNNVITVTGDLVSGMIPLNVAMEITGTETNTISSTYSPYTGKTDTTNTYRLAALTAVVGGAEAPQSVVAWSNAPTIIRKRDVWTLTSSGTDYSNIVVLVTYELP